MQIANGMILIVLLLIGYKKNENTYNHHYRTTSLHWLLLLAPLLLLVDAHTNPKHNVSSSIPVHVPLIQNHRIDWRDGIVENNNPQSHVYDRTNHPWLNFSKAVEDPPTDVYMYEKWFYGMERGVIVESGGLDGILFSNSYLFEQFLHWTSILIEADSINYRAMVTNRPRAINIHAALCNATTFTTYHYFEQGGCCSGIVELSSDALRDDIAKKGININSLPEIQCVPITYLLHTLLNIKVVDIWVLDVEGAEETVLLGTNFTQIHFNLIVYETCTATENERAGEKRKLALLMSNGFSCSTKWDLVHVSGSGNPGRKENVVSNNIYCQNNMFLASVMPNSTTGTSNSSSSSSSSSSISLPASSDSDSMHHLSTLKKGTHNNDHSNRRSSNRTNDNVSMKLKPMQS